MFGKSPQQINLRGRRSYEVPVEGREVKVSTPGILNSYLGQVGEVYSWTKDYENPFSRTPAVIALVKLLSGEMKPFSVINSENVEIGDLVVLVPGKKRDQRMSSNETSERGVIPYVPMARKVENPIEIPEKYRYLFVLEGAEVALIKELANS